MTRVYIREHFNRFYGWTTVAASEASEWEVREHAERAWERREEEERLGRDW